MFMPHSQGAEGEYARPLIILIRELSGTFHASGSSRFFTYSYLFFIRIFTFDTEEDTFRDELNPTVREQEIYEEMELTPEMVKSIRTLCGTCLRHFVDAKAFKIALVPSPDRSMDTCTVCQMRRGYDYVVMHR